ncbi:fungal-specific transcription factor domain-containing protein [Xylogone sp. PMI_703]|nr:fungal-specific transcription factor domain-containing protein [Xylogone sp. PMI_703]
MTSVPPVQKHPRSCITCHRRKLKCDKQVPCSNCKKSKFDCDYPSSRRTRRKSRPDSSASALKTRLEKLESLVRNLENELSKNTGEQPVTPTSQSSEHRQHHEIGRLISEGGQSRYIENSFWVAICNEVGPVILKTCHQISGLRNLIDEQSQESDNVSPTHSNIPFVDGDTFLYGFNTILPTLAELHPSPDHITLLWRIFVHNVDPAVRVLHKPTIERNLNLVKDAVQDLPNERKRLCESLMFSVYYAAITSLSNAQCEEMFKEGREALLHKYRFALQQALAKAQFLSSHHLNTLQAIIIYLNCERSHNNTRFVWTMTAVAIRIAQSLGLHHDGSDLDIPVFEAEMRRRIWWQLCIFDVRTAENHGFDQDLMSFRHFNTKLPLNINDDDISPSDTEPPTPRNEVTDMTLSLMRYEILSLHTQLNTQLMTELNPMGIQCADPNISVVDEVDRVTEACKEKLSHYLKYCDMSIPSHWFMTTISRLIIAKMWINLHHRFKTGCDEKRSEEYRQRILELSMEIVEASLLLEREKSLAHWNWAVRNYVPWQALAFILIQICKDPRPSDLMNRAWVLVENAFAEWVDGKPERLVRNCLWQRVTKLKQKAEKARAVHLQPTNVAGFSEILQQGNRERSSILQLGTPSYHSGEDSTPRSQNRVDDNNINANYGLIHTEGLANVQGNTQDNYDWLLDNEDIIGHMEYDPYTTIDWDTGTLSRSNNFTGEESDALFERLNNSWW